MHRRLMSVLAAAVAMTLLLAACGGDDTPAPDQGGGTPSETAAETPTTGGGPELTIVDFSFSPADLTVSDGDTITVANIGDSSHTFTTEDEAIDVTVAPGEEAEVTIEGVDSQDFHCRFHSQMTGTLTVE